VADRAVMVIIPLLFPRCRHFFELNSPHRPRLKSYSGSRGCCMSVADDVSYLSRFLVKFVEIIAAGLATAVSGYLIAHFTGALSSPAPAPTAAVIQVAPSASMQSSLPAQPTPPSSVDVSERPVPPQQEINAPPVAPPAPPQQEVNAPPVTQPARRSVNSAKTTPPAKHIETTTSAAESKRDHGSFVARVRAALGSADRTGSLDVAPPQSDVSQHPAAVASQPPSVADPSRAVAAAPPVATELRPVPVQQAPIEPNPPAAVEIKSRPVTSIESFPAPSPVKETEVLSPLEQMLRHDPLAGSDDAPRPPMPVGE
jgi:hypothetical protein